MTDNSQIEVWYVKPEQCGAGPLYDYSEPGWYWGPVGEKLSFGPYGSEADARAEGEAANHKSKSKPGRCEDCNDIPDLFILLDEVWESLWPEHPGYTSDEPGSWMNGRLCLHCVEGRLGRKLTREDFHPEVPQIDCNENPSDELLERAGWVRTAWGNSCPR